MTWDDKSFIAQQKKCSDFFEHEINWYCLNNPLYSNFSTDCNGELGIFQSCCSGISEIESRVATYNIKISYFPYAKNIFWDHRMHYCFPKSCLNKDDMTYFSKSQYDDHCGELLQKFGVKECFNPFEDYEEENDNDNNNTYYLDAIIIILSMVAIIAIGVAIFYYKKADTIVNSSSSYQSINDNNRYKY